MENTEKTPACFECETEVEEGQGIEVNGDIYCSDCHSEKFFVCEECSESCEQDDSVTVNLGTTWTIAYGYREREKTVCQSCAESSFESCDDCGEYVASCDTTHSGRSVCSTCRDNDYCSCDDCGDLYPYDMVSYSDRREAYYCESCYPSGDDIICDYGACACSEFGFKGTPAEDEKNLFFGVELEVNVARGYDEINAAIDCKPTLEHFCLLAEDCSIECGFEIKSAPASFEYHSNAWDEFFKWNKRNGTLAEVDENCGMHVHISRNALNLLQVGRMCAFVHNPANQALIQYVAERRFNTYWGIARYKGITTPSELRHGYDKYDAVNTGHDNTIEFRMFQSVVRRDSFLKNLEFVRALFHFTKQIAVDYKSGAEFERFVRNNAERFPHLAPFLKARTAKPRKTLELAA